jgi:hypothetical protein
MSETKKEDYNLGELKAQIRSNIDQVFAQADKRQRFFIQLIENFSYRYFEDPKCAPLDIEQAGQDSFIGVGRSFSMTKALSSTSGEAKTELIERIKQFQTTQRAESRNSLGINFSNLDGEGRGEVKVHVAINWDFHTFKDSEKGIEHSLSFKSEDWEHLRRQFPLVLEEACELF